MYTQCPHCETIFAIDAAQLEAAAGTVRCGECSQTFDARNSLCEQLPDTGPGGALEAPALESAEDAEHAVAAFEQQPAQPTEVEPLAEPRAVADTSTEEELTAQAAGDYEQALPEPAIEAAISEPTIPDEFIPEPETAPALDEEVIIPERPKAADTAPPRLTPDAAAILGLDELALKRGPTRGWFATTLWTLAILVLLAAFIGQYAYFFRDELARYGSVRPWLLKLCVLAECEVPLRKDLSLLEFASRDVRTHPDVPHALLVNVVFVNTASFPQPYPLLKFRLTNLNGATVASRSFRPAEYLDKGINITKGVTPNTPVHAKLEIKDPGEQAVSYEFDFH